MGAHGCDTSCGQVQIPVIDRTMQLLAFPAMRDNGYKRPKVPSVRRRAYPSSTYTTRIQELWDGCIFIQARLLLQWP